MLRLTCSATSTVQNSIKCAIMNFGVTARQRCVCYHEEVIIGWLKGLINTKRKATKMRGQSLRSHCIYNLVAQILYHLEIRQSANK